MGLNTHLNKMKNRKEGKKFPPFLFGNYRSEGQAIAPIAEYLSGSATIEDQVPATCARVSRARPIKPVAASEAERTISVVTATRSGETQTCFREFIEK